MRAKVEPDITRHYFDELRCDYARLTLFGYI